MKQSEVAATTNEFLRQIVERLLNFEAVKLEGFGELKLTMRKGGGGRILKAGNVHKGKGAYRPLEVTIERQYHVSVRKAESFKAAIVARHGSFVTVSKNMEKYGVDESGEELEKRAAQGCPICGAKPEKHGNVLACPTHGTEPFETNKKG